VTVIPGVGPQYPQPDERGWLVFDYLPNDLRNAEDSTALADYHRRSKSDGYDADRCYAYDSHAGREVWFFERDATAAERALLAHLGYAVPDELVTRVRFLTETLRRRSWPVLEPSETESEGDTPDD